MAALTDAVWASILAAAGPERRPDDEAAARADIQSILFVEYPAFAYDAERWAATFRQAQRMLGASAPTADGIWRRKPKPAKKKGPPGLLATLEAIHLAQFADGVIAERDLYAIEGMRRRWIAIWLTARAVRRANARRKNVQHEWLIHRLCGVWIERFHGELRVTVRSARDETPGGPAIDFLAVCAVQAAPELMSRSTLRDGLLRERDERERARQFALDLPTSA